MREIFSIVSLDRYCSGSRCPSRPGARIARPDQEDVSKPDADLDWSKIDLEALRQHLFDMNEVTLKADAATKTIDGGLEIAVTGTAARSPPSSTWIDAHAQEINPTTRKEH